jgi:hypothetical protein
MSDVLKNFQKHVAESLQSYDLPEGESRADLVRIVQSDDYFQFMQDSLTGPKRKRINYYDITNDLTDKEVSL